MLFSVLDQAPIPEGATAGEALKHSLALARWCDELGYERYWLAEHHGTPGLACNSPEVLIGMVAQETSRIRVGSGGIMLPHYSPLKVAETFSMLSGMFPGRIDLGIGRAAGTSPGVAFALQRDRRQRSPDDFPDQIEELRAYFDKAAADANGGQLRVVTRTLPRFHSPEMYLLGSSPQSAIWAAEWGLPYVYADFINADGGEIVEYYRRAFRPSASRAQPKVLVASWLICGESDGEALRLSASARMMMTMLHRGQLIAVPSVDKAERFLASEGLPLDTMPPGRRMLFGSRETIRRKVEALAEEYGHPDEMLLVNIMHDAQARQRSYELVAEEFGLRWSKCTSEAEDRRRLQTAESVLSAT